MSDVQGDHTSNDGQEWLAILDQADAEHSQRRLGRALDIILQAAHRFASPTLAAVKPDDASERRV